MIEQVQLSGCLLRASHGRFSVIPLTTLGIGSDVYTWGSGGLHLVKPLGFCGAEVPMKAL